mmetsp:Transcript_18747/g.56695  ORF Transcript_18747/g.56695 Transcript_18747/m.56695 type:complete len:488 (+) Transcript_18747:1634-3097(+)
MRSTTGIILLSIPALCRSTIVPPRCVLGIAACSFSAVTAVGAGGCMASTLGSHSSSTPRSLFTATLPAAAWLSCLAAAGSVPPLLCCCWLAGRHLGTCGLIGVSSGVLLGAVVGLGFRGLASGGRLRRLSLLPLPRLVRVLQVRHLVIHRALADLGLQGVVVHVGQQLEVLPLVTVPHLRCRLLGVPRRRGQLWKHLHKPVEHDEGIADLHVLATRQGCRERPGKLHLPLEVELAEVLERGTLVILQPGEVDAEAGAAGALRLVHLRVLPPVGHEGHGVLQEDAQVVGLGVGAAQNQRHHVLDHLVVALDGGEAGGVHLVHALDELGTVHGIRRAVLHSRHHTVQDEGIAHVLGAVQVQAGEPGGGLGAQAPHHRRVVLLLRLDLCRELLQHLLDAGDLLLQGGHVGEGGHHGGVHGVPPGQQFQLPLGVALRVLLGPQLRREPHLLPRIRFDGHVDIVEGQAPEGVIQLDADSLPHCGRLQIAHAG